MANFTVAGRLRSVGYAVAGLGCMLRTQHNAWIHLAATVLVTAAGIGLCVSGADWCWLVLAIVAVWLGEALNTAFEHLCDVVSPDFHPAVKRCKDIAAGAVLIAASGAVVIGGLVFIPYLRR